jgi:hypothetical protein
MEHLFSPCTRLRDLIEDRDHLGEGNWDDFERLQDLNIDVSTDEFLSTERGVYILHTRTCTLCWKTERRLRG